jgi:predicted DNA-binding protein
MKTQTNLRLSTETKSQLHQLQSVTGLNITEIVILAIDRMFNQDCYKTTDILWKVIDPKYLLPGEKPYNTTYTYFLRKTVARL